MKIIYKYELKPLNIKIINLPEGAEVLYVGSQRDIVYIWVLLERTTECTKERAFYVAGTGHPMFIEDKKYLGTCLTEQDSLVWHVFEII